MYTLLLWCYLPAHFVCSLELPSFMFFLLKHTVHLLFSSAVRCACFYWLEPSGKKKKKLTDLSSPLSLDLFSKLIDQKEDTSIASGSQTDSVAPASAPSQSKKWLLAFLRHPPASGARVVSPGLAWAQLTKALQIKQRAMRTRRHAHLRGRHHHPHNAQLMRVGCVLGTCQVQNLSHRLYQLIGQSGREDSSPINPKSPHSYGWVCKHLRTPTASLSISLFIYLLMYYL